MIELGTEPPRIKLYWVSPRTATYHFCCAQSRKSWDDFTSHDNAYLTRAHIKCFSRLEVNLFHRNLNGHFSDGQICEKEIIWRLNLVPRSFSDEAWGDRSGTRLLKYLKDDKERFHSRGQRLRKFTGAKESVYIIKEFMINTNMAVISLFWNTTLAALTSCENVLLGPKCKHGMVPLTRL